MSGSIGALSMELISLLTFSEVTILRVWKHVMSFNVSHAAR
uniref:Fructose-6-phosphate 2-kinase/fructose-2 6-bisphosphatase n=1 Tax=Rhizophora mucronata TaxID=61149 RepID=A0A2P2MUZ9_RHIMU